MVANELIAYQRVGLLRAWSSRITFRRRPRQLRSSEKPEHREQAASGSMRSVKWPFTYVSRSSRFRSSSVATLRGRQTRSGTESSQLLAFLRDEAGVTRNPIFKNWKLREPGRPLPTRGWRPFDPARYTCGQPETYSVVISSNVDAAEHTAGRSSR